jgi:hypothetical protein
MINDNLLVQFSKTRVMLICVKLNLPFMAVNRVLFQLRLLHFKYITNRWDCCNSDRGVIFKVASKF